MSFVAAKPFPYLNRRFRLGDEVRPEDFTDQETFEQYQSLGLIKERSPQASQEPAAGV
jgi:hypothetical protein